MDTKLSPVENPASWLMKLAYSFSRRKFGKVLSPLKVVYARLPLSFSLFSQKIEKLTAQMSIKYELALLVKTYVAQLNSCLFCIDIGKSMAIQKQAHSDKFKYLYEYETSPLFSRAEKAALKLAGELTTTKAVSQETFDEARKHFTERQVVEIVWCVAAEHYYNMINLAFDLHSDNLCDLEVKRRLTAVKA